MRKENSNYRSRFIEKSTIKHDNKYDYSQIPPKFKYNTIVDIVCPTHGVFNQRASAHVQGSGCQQCAIESHETNTYSKSRHTKEQFIQRAQQAHGTLYDYSESIYIGQMKSITIMCLTHGPFSCIANNHIHGTGCPSCRKSRGETKIELWLRRHNIPFISQQTFNGLVMNSTKPLKYDFFIPGQNLLIEFDGKQHYEPVPFQGVSPEKSIALHELTKKSDEIKTAYAVEHNINLLRISYKEIHSISRIMSNALLN